MKKYIKELGDLKRDLDVFFTDGHFEAKDAIDYAIKCIRKFENNTNWINVEDSLPEKADWYNVYTRDIVTMLFFDCSVEFKPCWLTIDGDWNDKVTYWQTLPLKPLQIKGGIIMNFEEYLQDIHAAQYQGLDDEMPDNFNEWLEELSPDEWIGYAEKWCKRYI